jgi:predicted GIY-YIG superfamily endonuclease
MNADSKEACERRGVAMVPKTIQIFLPSGDPRGIRIAEVTTRIVQAIEVPRSRLKEFFAMPESQQVGVYFLFGNTDSDDGPKVYIGQTGNLKQRLTKHNKSEDKDFWDRVIVVLSRTNSLTQTHALFLEWHCLQAVRAAGRYSDENGNSGTRPHTPPPLEADCLEIYETASTLLATLGHPLFLPLSGSQPTEEQQIYYCRKSEADARGLYTEEGFVVLKGSSGRIEAVESFRDSRPNEKRQNLIASGVILEEAGRLVFQKDHLFSSPSLAATAVMARHANGWSAWIDSNGRPLDDLRQENNEMQ